MRWVQESREISVKIGDARTVTVEQGRDGLTVAEVTEISDVCDKPMDNLEKELQIKPCT